MRQGFDHFGELPDYLGEPDERMRLLPSDPDIETLVGRIKSGDLDLQPDFQRGEVWSTAKKRRLIDSVLRDWHVPPIHVIDTKDKRQEVLDGQQRLVAIREFVDGQLTVDGRAEPVAAEIEALDGMTYAQLPPEVRRAFDRFTIRVFRVIDFTPEEPGELFFRLNQPTSLTSAEQRNAFFGRARQQVKDLVQCFASAGLHADSLGFSNSRMAYDDVVARTCVSLERGSLATKITASVLTERYREHQPFDEAAVASCEQAIGLLGAARSATETTVRFNKATLYSWLCFVSHCRRRVRGFTADDLADFLKFFETSRKILADQSSRTEGVELASGWGLPVTFHARMFSIYNDRASSRVADVSSVLSRHAVLWETFASFLAAETRSEIDLVPPIILEAVRQAKREGISADRLVDNIISSEHWGDLT